MKVYELADLYDESSNYMQIWNIDTGNTIFEGSFEEATDSKYAECEVGNFGVMGGIVIIKIFEEKE